MRVQKMRGKAPISKAWRAIDWAYRHVSSRAHVNIELEEVEVVNYYGSKQHIDSPIPPHVAIYITGYEDENPPEDYDLKLQVRGTFVWRDETIYIYYI